MILKKDNIKGVIFDVDGTLLDTMPMWDTVCEKYLIHLGCEPRDDLNEHVLNMTIDEGIRYIKECYHLEASEAKLKDGLLDMIHHFYYEEAPMKPGAKEMILALAEHRIPMAIATSGDRDLACTALRRLGVGHHIKEICSCNDFNTSKTEPFIFYRTTEALLNKKQSEFENDRELLSQIYVEKIPSQQRQPQKMQAIVSLQWRMLPGGTHGISLERFQIFMFLLWKKYVWNNNGNSNLYLRINGLVNK